MHHLNKYIGLEGLNKLTVGELRRGEWLISMLLVKLHELKPDRFNSPTVQERVRILIDLIRETLADRYQALSVLAFSHIMVALDGYLKGIDSKSGMMPGADSDNLAHVDKVFESFNTEIEAFQEWRTRQLVS
ncbi:MAG: hypothetical protein M1608_07325 [Candidatus Omnitrophica bacterium]|nr:hypothetical protein [Candidatus Omnitrophota bacterium]